MMHRNFTRLLTFLLGLAGSCAFAQAPTPADTAG